MFKKSKLLAIVLFCTSSFTSFAGNITNDRQILYYSLSRDGYNVSISNSKEKATAFMSKKDKKTFLFDSESSLLYLRAWGEYFPNGRLSYRYDSFSPKLCLNSYRPGNLRPVNIYSCNKTDPEQHWYIKKLDRDYGKVKVSLIGTNLCLNSHNIREGSKLTVYECTPGDEEQIFELNKHLRYMSD